MAVSNRSVVVAAASLLLLVGVAACSDDDKPKASSSSSTSASSASSASTAASSPASSAPAGSCDAAPPPGSSVRATNAQGDFNGDQETDTLTVYGLGTEDQPAPYHINIELGGSEGAVDDVIPDAATDSNSIVQALGGADITASAGLPPDGSGDEAFVAIGSGASARIVAVYQLANCVLSRITGPNGQQPSSFAIGGSITHLDGLKCDGTAGGQRLVQMSAESTDGVTYTTSEARLQVQNGQFSVTNTVNDTLDVNDPRLQTFGSLDCSGVINP